ncbi:MAG: NTP transferase domain-containing protein [Candidatus Levybacteria bacterium]|nr:NTP transferase domain-containing protein [Candidatus Levybacteria bacterium]MBI2420477.1 NTP transferase domain-containing protein [Candidatus Levybacteria bacterium]MBI4098265.1 NTP transferase domain-containing protein [Candidatus Levybacteria bacterium]
MKKIGAIILAAGKGTRMKSKKHNKVTLPLGDKPMIKHSVDLLKDLGIHPVVIVVGFAKNSVKALFNGDVIFAEQTKRLGTAHALLCGLRKLPEDVEDIVVLNGDDSAFYTKDIIESLLNEHFSQNNSVTLLTLEVSNPKGLGRIVRNSQRKVVSIVEEKDATPKEREIKEINPACYIFNINFLRKHLREVKKSPITGEYYIVTLVEVAIKNNENLSTVNAGLIPWRGINTSEELKEAENLFLGLSKKESTSA